MKLIKNEMRQLLANSLPWLGTYRRLIVALVDMLSPVRHSYAQYEEDRIVLDILKKTGFIKSEPFVDIGANHPTSLSNSYLLYRNGYQGITIEPNLELIKLHKLFRPRDTALAIGCSDINTVLSFNVSTTPVRSTFVDEANGKFTGKYAVPVMRVDDITSEIAAGQISLLSIDVEGMNAAVLRGASNTIRRSKVICVEFDNEADKKMYENLFGDEFKLEAETVCNRIYRNLKEVC